MKKMKKVLCLLLAVSMFAAMTGCSSSKSDSSSATVKATKSSVDTSNMGKSLKEIYERGYLVVGIDSGYPPFSFQDPKNGDTYGIAVDIAKKVADKLGVSLKVIPESFGTLLSDLQTDKLDLVCACVTVTDQRKQTMAFSDPYISTADVMVVKTSAASKYTNLDSFVGTKIAANNGTTQETNAEKVKNATVIATESTSDAVLQVVSGTADACVVDNVNGLQYIEANKGQLTMVKNAAFSYSDKAIALQLGNEDLQKVVNGAIADMKPDMDNLIDKYTKLSLDVLGIK